MALYARRCVVDETYEDVIPGMSGVDAPSLIIGEMRWPKCQLMW